MIACAVSGDNKEVSYYATTFDQARDIAWSSLKELTKSIWAQEPNNTLLELHIKTIQGGVSRIRLRSWEAVEKARGTQNDFIVLDEVSKMKNFKEGWQAVLLGTLAFRNGTALFISTPYGYNHFHDIYQLGQGGSPDYKSWKFTSFDNPHLSKEYLRTIEATVTPDFWAQEYLADFRRFTGLVLKEFDLVKHVSEFPFTKDQHGSYLFGQDFAVRGYTAALPLYINSDGHHFFLDNYKVQNKTATEHGPDIQVMLEKYATFTKYNGFSDPAGWIRNQQGIKNGKEMVWSLADEYIEQGFPIAQANNDVSGGINFVRQLFLQDKITIHPRCTDLIDEILQYQWKDQPDNKVGQQNVPEEVRKFNDHLVDSMRYVLYSKPTTPEEEKPQLLYKEGMLLEFPHWATTPNIERNNDPNKDTFDVIE